MMSVITPGEFSHTRHFSKTIVRWVGVGGNVVAREVMVDDLSEAGI